MINNEMQSMPYFMQNKEWYYFDEENFCYKLTDKAPPKLLEATKNFMMMNR